MQSKEEDKPEEAEKEEKPKDEEAAYEEAPEEEAEKPKKVSRRSIVWSLIRLHVRGLEMNGYALGFSLESKRPPYLGWTLCLTDSKQPRVLTSCLNASFKHFYFFEMSFVPCHFIRLDSYFTVSSAVFL